jgi:hypothetical protein
VETKLKVPRLLPATAAVAAFLVFFVGRGYPWQLALLAAAAIGALVYVALRSLQNMRHLTATSAAPIRASPNGTENRSAPPPAADGSNPEDPSR